MTPKEKAKELVYKYFEFVEAYSVQGQNENAKRCALIAVDLAIEYNDFHIEFLQEVKQEINNL